MDSAERRRILGVEIEDYDAPGLIARWLGRAKPPPDADFCNRLQEVLKGGHAETHTLDLTPWDQTPPPRALFRRELMVLLRSFIRTTMAVLVLGTFLYLSRNSTYMPEIVHKLVVVTAIFADPLRQQVLGSAAAYVPLLPFLALVTVLVAILLTLPLIVYLYQLTNQPPARTVLDKDKRRPVVLIRPFADDDAPVYDLIPGDGEMGTSVRRRRFEEAVAPMFRRIGPFVAIGNPRSHWPEPGAARARFADDQWQIAITEMLRQARLIVLVCSFNGRASQADAAAVRSADALAWLPLTRGVRWEIEHILQNGLQHKLLVLLPRKLSLWGRQLVVAEQSLILGPVMTLARWLTGRPPTLAQSLTKALAMHAKSDGTVLIVRSRQHARSCEDYARAIQLACYTMFCGADPAIATAPADDTAPAEPPATTPHGSTAPQGSTA